MNDNDYAGFDEKPAAEPAAKRDPLHLQVLSWGLVVAILVLAVFGVIAVAKTVL